MKKAQLDRYFRRLRKRSEKALTPAEGSWPTKRLFAQPAKCGKRGKRSKAEGQKLAAAMQMKCTWREAAA